MRERHNPDEKRKDNDLWRDDISFIAVWGWDLALACAPFRAKSCIWPQCWSPSKSSCTQTERHFLYTPSPFVVSGHFVHGDLLLLPPDSSFFPTSKFFAWGHQWSLWILLYYELLRDGFVSLLEVRHSPAPLSRLVRTPGPQAKLIVHKLIQPPWFCLFKWDS